MKTNYEAIKEMSVEEMAYEIECPTGWGVENCPRIREKSCHECIVDWLNAPAEEEDDAT